MTSPRWKPRAGAGRQSVLFKVMSMTIQCRRPVRRDEHPDADRPPGRRGSRPHGRRPQPATSAASEWLSGKQRGFRRGLSGGLLEKEAPSSRSPRRKPFCASAPRRAGRMRVGSDGHQRLWEVEFLSVFARGAAHLARTGESCRLAKPHWLAMASVSVEVGLPVSRRQA